MSHVQMNTADSVTQNIHNSSFSGQIDIIHIYLDVQISLQPITICSHPIKQTSNKAIRDGKYLARHMPVLGKVHPIKIENVDIFFVTSFLCSLELLYY